MVSPKWTNGQFINGFRSTHRNEVEGAFNQLHKEYFGLVESLVVKNNGKKNDTHQLFNDSAMVLYKQVRKTEFKLTAALKTYFYSIARNKWMEELRKRKKNKEIHLIDEYEWIPITEDIAKRLELNEGQKILNQLLSSLKEDCKTIIHLYYYSKLKLSKIAEQMGIVNEAAVKNRKARCLKKLRTIVAGNLEYQKYLKDYLNDL